MMRKQPIYFVIDSPSSMCGEPIRCFSNLIREFIQQAKLDPWGIETFHISIISTNSENVEILQPLADLASVEGKIPLIYCQGKSNVFKGLEILKDRVAIEVEKTNKVKKGDYRPVLFLMVGTIPQSDFTESDLEYLNKTFVSGRSGSIHSILSIDTNKKSAPNIIYYKNEYVGGFYRRIFRNVVNIETIDNYFLLKHFTWTS